MNDAEEGLFTPRPWPLLGPLVVRSGEMSPPQPAQGLDEATVAGCQHATRDWLRGDEQRRTPIVLTYSTKALPAVSVACCDRRPPMPCPVPEMRLPCASQHWVLGFTAAMRGFPLVVAGQGYAPFDSSSGYVGKIWGGLRAMQVIDRLAPGSMVLSLDTTDTFLVNELHKDLPNSSGGLLSAPAPPALAADVIASVAREQGIDPNRTLLASAECASFPRCYDPLYAASEFEPTQACLRRHEGSTCYANAGGVLARSEVMLSFFKASAASVVSWRQEANARSASSLRVRVANRHNWPLG